MWLWRLIATLGLVVGLTAGVLPLRAEDDCASEELYCDDAASFKVNVPRGFQVKSTTQHLPDVKVMFVTENGLRLACPVVSEAHLLSARWQDLFLRKAFWDAVFDTAFGPTATVRLIHDRETKKGRKHPSAWNKHQISLVHATFMHRGVPFEAWQAAYWKKTVTDTGADGKGATPVPSRIYFLNCTKKADEGPRAPRLTPPAVPETASGMFETFTPTVCTQASKRAPCPPAQGLVAETGRDSTVSSELPGDDVLLDAQMRLLLESGRRAAVSGANQ